MIHHVSVGTNDLALSRRFYDAVLPNLGPAYYDGRRSKA